MLSRILASASASNSDTSLIWRWQIQCSTTLYCTVCTVEDNQPSILLLDLLKKEPHHPPDERLPRVSHQTDPQKWNVSGGGVKILPPLPPRRMATQPNPHPYTQRRSCVQRRAFVIDEGKAHKVSRVSRNRCPSRAQHTPSFLPCLYRLWI
ncbi:hypothetical protein I7I53_08530 [Histoplasma capsulatum var. duboisii H88]|uniref:Uncharacterized protein n=1 Tax=Ajellomyces capsulatus (strain H88) TaxID=544711 RepID=A0A8A1LFF7_AJEC8|nr:hypothetical protein I7I53_08530 [Histoplasma capsulatum var. duboisii H88]